MYYFNNPVSIPKGTRYLLIISVAVWLLEIIPGVGNFVLGAGALFPSVTFGSGQIWRLATYLFIHDPTSPFHILFNMLALWMFGVELEQMWGTRRFIVFYLLSGIVAGLFGILQWNACIIGASGAILALLTVYAMYFPRRTVLMFFVFPLPVRYAVVVIGLMSLWGASSGAGNVAYLTHLGGIAFGLAYYFLPPYIKCRREGRKKSHDASETKILQFRKKTSGRNDETYFQSNIDPILKKISLYGLESLSAEEHRILEEASRKK
jgi:membrane associated rhomboid family serine protease